MSETAVDSYSQKLTECRLDPIGDPLIDRIREPYPFSLGFSTGEVSEKALGWQQELAARVREYQECPDIPLRGNRGRKPVSQFDAEAAEAVKALSVAFLMCRSAAPKEGSFPVKLLALKEDRKDPLVE
jgi:hypothetical protein